MTLTPTLTLSLGLTFLPKWSAIRPEGTSKTYVKAKVTECSTPIWKSEEKAGQGAESSDAPGEVRSARSARSTRRGRGGRARVGINMGPS